jgi:hypothetical protein
MTSSIKTPSGPRFRFDVVATALDSITGLAAMSAGLGFSLTLSCLGAFAAAVVSAVRLFVVGDRGGGFVMILVALFFNPILPGITLLAGAIVHMFSFRFHEPYDSALLDMYRFISMPIGVGIIVLGVALQMTRRRIRLREAATRDQTFS